MTPQFVAWSNNPDGAAYPGAYVLFSVIDDHPGIAGTCGGILVQRVREGIRSVFAGDERSVDALEAAIADPGDEGRVRELASALAYYAGKNEEFARQLADWARHGAPASVTQNITAGRDAYVAGHDMTVRQRPVD